MKSIDISIIYVNYFSEDQIQKSLNSLINFTEKISYEVIIVDNSVNSESKIKLKELKKNFSFIKLIFNEKNYGFGKGCNIGVKEAVGKYIAFINPDVIFENNALLILKGYLDKNKKIGAAGCLTYEGERSYLPGGARKFHTIFNEFLERSNLVKLLYKNPYYFRWDFNSTKFVDALMGAMFLTRKKIFNEIGGFDENFFLYYEEIDFFKRLWNAGYKVIFIDKCTIIHKGGASIRRKYKDEEILLLNLKSAKYYFTKHHGRVYSYLWSKMIFMLYFFKYLITQDKTYLTLAKWGLKN